MASTSKYRTLATCASTSTRIEEQVQFSLFELTEACRADTEQLVALVNEGALTPIGDGPQRWRFAGVTLQRARTALRLTHDLELNAPGAALVLDLLDQIDTLRAQLRRVAGD
ncbi:MAG: MerR family transcriptional regulator [Bacteriovorax sp.]|nr:MerR family transcriptional regulator [Rhizobacter sp.]